MTYEQFIKLVPNETKQFIRKALPYLDAYINRGMVLLLQHTVYSLKSSEEKAFYLLCHLLKEEKKYASLFSKFLFDNSEITIGYDRIDRDFMRSEKTIAMVFENIASVLPHYDDELDYCLLSPLDIVLDLLNKISNKSNFLDKFRTVFKNVDYPDNLKKELIYFDKQQKAETIYQLEHEVFKDLPVSVISYLETASKIRRLLLVNGKNQDNQLMSNVKIDSVSLSLMLALFYYQDTPLPELENISEQSIITAFLEEQQISAYAIC